MKLDSYHRRVLRIVLSTLIIPALSVLSQAQTAFVNIDTIMQVSYLQPYYRPFSNHIEVLFRYGNPSGAPVRYLNLYAKMPTGLQQMWAAENLMLDTFPNVRSLTYTISLAPLGIKDGDAIPQVDLVTLITDTVVTQPRTFPPSAFQGRLCGMAYWNYGSGISHLRLDTVRTSPVRIPRPGNHWTETDSVRKVTRGCAMPNIDLDSGANNAQTKPGYAGDWNACSPAGCANSLQWLEARHPGKISSGTTLREKLDSLSRLMKRRNSEGVFTDTMIAGKLAFIDKYKLPIRVKFQSVFYKDSCIKSFDTTYKHCAQNQSANQPADTFRLSFDWLYNEMKNGEDVEMNVGWWTYDSTTGTGKWTGGHTVVLTGVEDIRGVKRIIVKDDASQAIPGGTAERPLTMDSTGWKGYPHRIKEWSYSEPDSHRNTTVVIKDWVSESYDSTVTFPSTGIGGVRGPNPGLMISGNPIEPGSGMGISFQLQTATRLRLAIVDVNGRTVSVLANENYPPGKHTLYWRGAGSNGADLPSGVYFIVLTTGNGVTTAKVLKL